MNLKTAALRLGVHYQTAYRWVRSGQLVAVKVGAGYEISEAAVARLQAQRGGDGTDAGGRCRAGPRPSTRRRASRTRCTCSTRWSTPSRSTRPRSASAAARVVGRAPRRHGVPVPPHRRRRDGRRLRRAPGSRRRGRGVHAGARSAHVDQSRAARGRRTGELICVPQVPQRELRRRLHPELHETPAALRLLQRAVRADRRRRARCS